MKGLKTLLGVVAAATLLGAFSFSASAQENANRDENGNVVRGAYVTNGIEDNWFLGGGIGINTVQEGYFHMNGHMGFATDIHVGKWLTPVSGLQIGWHGLNNEPNGKWHGTVREHVAFNYIHAEYLFNASNYFSGYKETRFWDVIPYFTTGVLITGSGGPYDGLKDYIKQPFSNWEFAAGFGVRNEFRINEKWDAIVDIQDIVAKASSYSSKGRFIAFPSITVGASWNFGERNNFDRLSSIMPVVIPLSFTEEEYNGLKDKVAALEKENAALKDKIAELEARGPVKEYIETGVSAVTLYFDMGQTTVSDREMAHLEYFASEVAKDKELSLVGSADSKTGSAKRNAYLAAERAKVVKNLLVKAGFDADKISIDTTTDAYNTPAKSRVVTVNVK